MTTTIAVPDGAAPGFKMMCTAPDGAEVQLTLPMGISPGSTIQLKKDQTTGLWTMAEPATTTTNQVPLGSVGLAGSVPAVASMATTSIASIQAPTIQLPAGNIASAPTTVFPTAPSASAYAAPSPTASLVLGRTPSYTPPVMMHTAAAMPALPVHGGVAPLPMVQPGLTPLPQVFPTAMPTPGIVGTMTAFPTTAPYVAPDTVVRTPSYTPPPVAATIVRTPSYTPPVVEFATGPPMPFVQPGFMPNAAVAAVGMPTAAVMQTGPAFPAMPSAGVVPGAQVPAAYQVQQTQQMMQPGMMPMQPGMMPMQPPMGMGMPYGADGMPYGAGPWPCPPGKGGWPGGPEWGGYGKGGQGGWDGKGRGNYNPDGSKGGGKGFPDERGIEDEPWMDIKGNWHKGKGGR